MVIRILLVLAVYWLLWLIASYQWLILATYGIVVAPPKSICSAIRPGPWNDAIWSGGGLAAVGCRNKLETAHSGMLFLAVQTTNNMTTWQNDSAEWGETWNDIPTGLWMASHGQWWKLATCGCLDASQGLVQVLVAMAQNISKWSTYPTWVSRFMEKLIIGGCHTSYAL